MTNRETSPRSEPERFYVTGGTIPQSATCYVERAADSVLLKALLGGEYCHVLASRQIGKSSLMVRAAGRLRERGVTTLVLDLTAVGRNVTPEQWYDGLLNLVGRQLGMQPELDDFWLGNERLGPLQRWFEAIREVVMPVLGDRALVVFVDEVDSVRGLPFSTDEFFAAIRECHNRRPQDPELGRLTFCLLGVALPSDLIRDPLITPYNVGRRVELADFSFQEALPLADGFGRDDDATRFLQRVLEWTGGHPYLTQRLCASVLDSGTAAAASVEKVVDDECRRLFLVAGGRAQDENILFVQQSLLRSDSDGAGVLQRYAEVLSGRTVPDDDTMPHVASLRLSGVVRAEAGRLQVRNRIYSSLFDRRWITDHMPDSELRRQRAAFYRGVLRTGVLALLVIFTLAAAVLTALHQAGRAQRALGRAYLEQARALRTAVLPGRRFTALEALSAAARIRPSPEQRDAAIAAMALVDLRPGWSWRGHPPGSRGADVAASLERYVRSDDRGVLSLRTTRDDRELFSLPGPGAAADSLRFSADGRWLAAKYADAPRFTLAVWNLDQRSRTLRIETGLPELCADFTADGRGIAVGERGGTFSVYSLLAEKRMAGKRLARSGSGPELSAIRCGGAGRYIAALSENQIRICDAKDARVTSVIPAPTPLANLDISENEHLLAAGGADFHIYVWDLSDRGSADTVPRVLTGHQAELDQLAFDHRGDILASLAWDGMLRLWDPSGGTELLRMPAGVALRPRFDANDRSLCIASTGSHLTGNADIRFSVLDLANGSECQVLRESFFAKSPWSVAFGPSGQWLTTGGTDAVRVWSTASGKLLHTLFAAEGQAAVVSPDGHLYGGGREVRRWSLSASGDSAAPGPGALTRRDVTYFRRGGSLALSANGRLLAMMDGNRVKLLDAASGKMIRSLPAPPGANCLALDPEGRLLAVGTWRGTVLRVIDTASGAVLRDLPCEPAYPAFSPDGTWLAAGGGSAYRFWRVRDWRESTPIRRYDTNDLPGPIAFAPDGRTFAVARTEWQVELFDLPTRTRLAALTSPEPRMLSWLAFSPDGSRFAASCETHTTYLWDLSRIRTQLRALHLDW